MRCRVRRAGRSWDGSAVLSGPEQARNPAPVTARSPVLLAAADGGRPAGRPPASAGARRGRRRNPKSATWVTLPGRQLQREMRPNADRCVLTRPRWSQVLSTSTTPSGPVTREMRPCPFHPSFRP